MNELKMCEFLLCQQVEGIGFLMKLHLYMEKSEGEWTVEITYYVIYTFAVIGCFTWVAQWCSG